MEENEEKLPEQNTAPEETPAKSRKDSYMEGFKSKHPDWQEGDEEGFYGTLSDDNAAMEEEMNGYRSREEEMSSALGNSPMNAALFMDAASGKPIPLALLERFPEEIKSWMDDPSNSEALKKTFEEHANKIEQNKKLQAEADSNLEESNSLIDGMIADGKLASEEEANQCLELLANIAAGLMVNHVEEEWLLAAKKAINHDTDVETARTQGEIEGRNAKITAQRKGSNRGGNMHAGLGSSNAGGRLSAAETAAANGGQNTRRSMWDGGKITELN